MTYVERTKDALFNPTTIASFEGAGLVNDHPDFRRHPDGLTADNAAELSGGMLVNVRPGKDGDEDVLLGDLIVTRQDFIDAINSGKREISAGYDAAYETVRPGYGRQHNIIGNHIALVSKGRCGPRCAIGDHAPSTEKEPIMAGNNGGQERRRIKIDDVEYEEVSATPRRRITADSADDEGIHVHIHNGESKPTARTSDAGGEDGGDPDKRFTELQKTVDAIAGAVTTLGESLKAHLSAGNCGRTGDAAHETPEQKAAREAQATADAAAAAKRAEEEAAMTADSAALATSWQELISKTEILVPGFAMPTFDAKQPRKLTVDAMCATRRKALEQYGATEDGKKMLTAMVGDAALKDMACDTLAVVFNGCAAAKASANNATATRDSRSVQVVDQSGAAKVTPAQLNAAYAKFFSKQGAQSRAA
jgi:hypothetical protein